MIASNQNVSEDKVVSMLSTALVRFFIYNSALLYIFKNDAYVTVVKMITLKWENIYGNKQ